MIATTIEQSKYLLELGLSPDSADMEYCYIDEFNSGLQVKGDINAEVDRRLDMMFGVTHIPAWSLSALLDVMPNNDYWDIYLCQAQDGKWQSVFHDCEFSNGEYKDFIADTPFTAAYEMVCWLLKQGLIKKGGQDERD